MKLPKPAKIIIMRTLCKKKSKQIFSNNILCPKKGQKILFTGFNVV